MVIKPDKRQHDKSSAITHDASGPKKKRPKKSRSRSTLIKAERLPSEQEPRNAVATKPSHPAEESLITNDVASSASLRVVEHLPQRPRPDKSHQTEDEAAPPASTSSSHVSSSSPASPVKELSSPDVAESQDEFTEGRLSLDAPDKDEDAPPILAPADFASLYLAEVTREFADDIEKLRHAPDFKGQKSVEMLVQALQQGSTLFTEDEKRRIMADSGL